VQLDIINNAVPTIVYFNNRNNTPNWRIEPAKTDFIDLTYVIRGQATYTIDQEKINASEGDVLCIPKHSHRAAVSENPTQFECFAANFQMHCLTTHTDVNIPLPLISGVGIHSDILSLFRRLNEDWLSRLPGYNMRTRAHLMLILQRFMTMLVYDINTYNFDSRVKWAIRYIADNYASDITITEVAEAVSLHPIYFGTLFIKETNTIFRDYLNTIRLNQAEDMLRTGKRNVTEVAHSCGFTDVSYFSRLFKKHKGVSPSTLR
jgi:AraC-like DNA-binding protein